MEATGWDWPTLKNTPAEVVNNHLLYLEAHVAYQRSLSGAKDGGGTLGSR